MRGDHLDPFGDGEAGRRRGDQEPGDPFGRRDRVIGARKDTIEVGDPAVGDPHLLAIESPAIIHARSAHGEGGGVGAGVRFREREGGDRLPARDLGEPGLLERVVPGEGEGTGAEPLHGEGEVSEGVMRGEGLAEDAEVA